MPKMRRRKFKVGLHDQTFSSNSLQTLPVNCFKLKFDRVNTTSNMYDNTSNYQQNLMELSIHCQTRV